MTNPLMWPAPDQRYIPAQSQAPVPVPVQPYDPAFVPAPAPVKRGSGHAVMTALRVTGLLFVWMMQYGVYVPLVLCWRMTVAAFKMGAVGLLLLCIPMIGWVVLIMMVMNHPSPHRSNIWRPWGLRRR